jgi:hypothetical protein
MAKSKRRLTLRERVDRLERQNMHLKAQARGWKRAWEDANHDFDRLVRVVKQGTHIADGPKPNDPARYSEREAKEIMDRAYKLIASLELATRDPTSPLQ